MKRYVCIALAAGLIVGLVGSASAGAPKPTVVFEDAAGDAGNQDSGIPGADQAGFDLVSGSIVRNKDNLDFTVTHSAMPPNGALPEGFRFMWGFSVGDKSYRITVKSADIGKPNPVTQSDTDRIGKVDAQGFYRLEGDCIGTTIGVLNAVNCTTLGYPEGKFDPASKSFTVSVPMKLIGAKPGSVIGPGGGDAVGICAICWSTHVAERSLNTTNIDSAAMTKTYKVPK